MNEFWSTLSLLFMLITYVPYVVGILRKETAPCRTTWIIWALLNVMMAWAMFHENTLNAQIIGACIGSTVIAILSLRYGKAGWSRLDILCLVGGILGLTLWALTKDPSIGIAVAGVINLVGAIPTIASAWEDPAREPRWAWMLAFLSCVSYLPVLPSPHAWTIANATQPLVFLLIQTVMVCIVWLP